MYNTEKTNDPILRNLSDRRTDRLVDRLMRVISYDAVRLTSSVQKELFNHYKKIISEWAGLGYKLTLRLIDCV